jgi:hypothetical protein
MFLKEETTNTLMECNIVRLEVLKAVTMKMAVFWAVAPALMMEAVQTYETFVNSYQSTWSYNPEVSHLRA